MGINSINPGKFQIHYSKISWIFSVLSIFKSKLFNDVYVYLSWLSQINKQEGRQNLNIFLETFHLAPTQFCEIPGFYRKTGFCHPLSLIDK